MTCTSCSYEFCWICNASYSNGHLQTHADAVRVQVPGHVTPLLISKTPHKIFKRGVNGVMSTEVNGRDIASIFRDHDVVKMVNLSQTNPITGETTFTEGILLKKKPKVAGSD